MKRSKINDLFVFLGDIKLNKLPKELRADVMSNHLKLYKVVKEFNSDIDELYKKYFDDKKEEVEQVKNLREKFVNSTDTKEKQNIINTLLSNHEEFLALEKEFLSTRDSMLDEDVEITLNKVNAETFIDTCIENNMDITANVQVICEDMFE